MSIAVNKNAAPPTIPGSGKYKSLEAENFKIDDTLFATNLTASGTITATTITDGTASLSGGTLTGLNAPVAATDATNKAYVDSLLGGTWLGPVTTASTGNLTLSGLQTIDGVSLAAGDRILVKDQTTGSENGVYDVATGAWPRSSDLDTGASAGSVVLVVNQGTTNQGRIYQCTNFTGSDIVGTNALVFVQFAGSSASPGGADTNIQFNDLGSFGGSNNLTWNGTSLAVTGNVSSTATVSGATVTATGTVSGATVSGTSVTATGTVSGATVSATGTVSGTSVTATGTVSGATVLSTGIVTGIQFIATSDATLKKEVEPLDEAMRKLDLLDPVQYKFNHTDDDEIHYGVLAQDLQDQGLGSMVHEVDGHLAVSYNDIIGLLIGSVQELKNEITELKRKL